MNLLCLPRYGPLGASSRVRMRQYYPALTANASITLVETPLLDDDYLGRKYGGLGLTTAIVRCYARRVRDLIELQAASDILWLEKEAWPWMPARVEAAALRRPYVLDIDDAVFHNYDLHRSGWLRRALGRKIDRLMAGAALVTAGNDYLAERAQRAGAHRVELLPTVVDVDRYATSAMPRTNPDAIRIVWIGSPSTVHYLRQLAAPLAALGQRRRLTLVVIGGGPIELPGVVVESQSWSEATEVESIQSSDIGVMPLPDSPWERGKCGYKLIQYMACGLPVVGSPVGVNRSIVQQGVNGFLATDEAEWVASLTALADDAELRAGFGAAGRALVEQRYSLQVNAPRLLHWMQAAAPSVGRH